MTAQFILQWLFLSAVAAVIAGGIGYAIGCFLVWVLEQLIKAAEEPE